MASFNRVILMGNLTRDPELRYVGSGIAVTDVGLAVNDRRKNANGEWIEETTFVDVTLWGRTAEVANQYLSKGSPLFVEGRLKLDTWESQDGQKRSKLRVVCERMQLIGSKGGGGAGGQPRDVSEYSRPIDSFDPSEMSGPAMSGPAMSGPAMSGAGVGAGGASAGPGSSGTRPQQGEDIPF